MLFASAASIPHAPKQFGQSFGHGALSPPHRMRRSLDLRMRRRLLDLWMRRSADLRMRRLLDLHVRRLMDLCVRRPADPWMRVCIVGPLNENIGGPLGDKIGRPLGGKLVRALDENVLGPPGQKLFGSPDEMLVGPPESARQDVSTAAGPRHQAHHFSPVDPLPQAPPEIDPSLLHLTRPLSEPPHEEIDPMISKTELRAADTMWVSGAVRGRIRKEFFHDHCLRCTTTYVK
ncbi:hypothetical protein PGT21_000550 [Puccinia graminis f. sp. tritici]|uniref:Uncharacterized protein n=1 Tax=Puccinia graminis f. sp. tritici TaxID=56615 RepID=A0A5B0QSE1_PUCGR|nr:hypothetical protein PGTUg99_002943 [Puccinia graminis f. sp. tritici]KAA1115845.1 hypothetical protein PGT21_000550 [Puccinia graminis f. sp. tritici]